MESQIRILTEENKSLKKVLAICLNKTLIKRLSDSLNDIEQGNYLTEEEFFNKHQKVIA